MRNVRIVERSLSDLIYDLVLFDVRERVECLDGWVASKDGKLHYAVSVTQEGTNLIATSYQDTPLTDDDKEAIRADIDESVFEDDEWDEEQAE